jgi:uncharacterized caspase-like protein
MSPILKHVLLLLILSVSYLQSQSQRQIYAVIVGVSDYKNDQYNLDLNYCDDDANLFYKLLLASGVNSQNMILLKDYKASKQKIINALDRVFSKAKASDEVIFYFSGHGSEGCFLPYDFNGSGNLLYHSEVKAAFKKCSAQKKLCIADACYSGSIKIKSANKITKNTSLNKASSNIVVLMSSRSNQTSIELPTLGHGAFSHYLVQGLKGFADKNGDKTITVSEMYYYTRDAVMQRTGQKQTPIIFGKFNENMPVLYLK